MNRLPFNPMFGNNQPRFPGAGPFPGGGGPNRPPFNNRAGILGDYVRNVPPPAFASLNPMQNRMNLPPGMNSFNLGNAMGPRGFNHPENMNLNQPDQQPEGRNFNQSDNRNFNQTENRNFNQPENRNFNQSEGRNFDQSDDRGFPQSDNSFNDSDERRFKRSDERGFNQSDNRDINQPPSNMGFNQLENRKFAQSDSRDFNRRENRDFKPPNNRSFGQNENRSFNQPPDRSHKQAEVRSGKQAEDLNDGESFEEMPSMNFQDYLDGEQDSAKEQKARDREKRGERERPRRERRSRWEEVPKEEELVVSRPDPRSAGDRLDSRREERGRHDDVREERGRRDEERGRRDYDRERRGDRERRENRSRRDDRDRERSRERRDDNRNDIAEENDSQDSSHSGSYSGRDFREGRDVSREGRDANREGRDFGRDGDRQAGRDSRDSGRDRREGRNSGREGGGIDRDGRDYGRDRRDNGRDRDNGREGRDGRHQSSGGPGDDRSGEKWMQDRPSNTILLRGLPFFVTEAHIQKELKSFDVPAKDVRLMKRRETGSSRGFAFVEFQNVQDAQRWMDRNQGSLYLEDLYQVHMHYSHPRDRNENSGSGNNTAAMRYDPTKGDWICSKCGVHNFKRRDHCFQCNLSREDSEKTEVDDGSDQVGTNPCNTLVLRGLDALTTEESLQTRLTALAGTPTKNIIVIRDPLTNVSKSYAFAELASVQQSTHLLEMLTAKNTPFELDGKVIIVNYAKNTYSTVMASMDASNYQDYSQYYAQQGYESYYDQSGQYYDYSSYYGYEQPQVADPKASNQADSTNAAAAVAQAAIRQAKAVKDFHKQVHQQQQISDMSREQRLAYQAQQWTQHQPQETPAQTQPATPTPTSTTNEEYTKYPVPDVSTYQYDETSGYYYDPMTSLYYDAASQYYFNATTGQFMYWDGEKSTYLPAPTNTEGGEDGVEIDGKAEPKDKKEKVKMAKKIAKDMEKWAKSMNAQKESVKDRERKMSQQSSTKRESLSADAGFSILEKSNKKDDMKLMPPPPGPLASKAAPPAESAASALVGDYGGDSDSDEESEHSADPGVIDESKYIDWEKIACLLCKRQFPTKDALQRHQQLSGLHKQNLANLYKARSSAQAESVQPGGQYRDRAKERRKKYGTPAPPEPKKGRFATPAVPYEEPNKTGITQDNKGNKLLQKMGWSEGTGLGSRQQGIVDPIMAQRRQAGAGLGARGSNYGAVAGDNYRDTVKKMMTARYEEFQ